MNLPNICYWKMCKLEMNEWMNEHMNEMHLMVWFLFDFPYQFWILRENDTLWSRRRFDFSTELEMIMTFASLLRIGKKCIIKKILNSFFSTRFRLALIWFNLCCTFVFIFFNMEEFNSIFIVARYFTYYSSPHVYIHFDIGALFCYRL